METDEIGILGVPKIMKTFGPDGMFYVKFRIPITVNIGEKNKLIW